MKRPLPPELISLGDHLETAAARAVGRRRTRRQMLLNSLTSLVVAVPLAATLVAGAIAPGANAPGAPPAVTASPNGPSFARGDGDFPPRNLRRPRDRPKGDLLVLPPDQRRALR